MQKQSKSENSEPLVALDGEREARLLAYVQEFRKALSLKGIAESCGFSHKILEYWVGGTRPLPQKHVPTLEAFFERMRFPPGS
ncbi:hypothetical protein [Hymenobacter guriensis]|uniref:XRE family transcriptional regulator n=1 Tax=Hymenobacter guriensis TaxID=2793065 RepID=A0ABS0KYY3_9BACT|nr:hypothetical protein [Hymenobacter guriensis]MBG8553073.1 hypothetical protein [Hymenobacter guriensis]